MAKLRLILDIPRAAAINMALDEVLLNGETWAIRRTAWQSPATTLGRFQTYQQFKIDGKLRPSIRRITGGGAIFHGEDCTLALVLPTPSPPFPDSKPIALATRAAQCLEAALAALGKSTSIREGNWEEKAQQHIDDCFLRRSPFDLVVDSEPSKKSAVTKAAGIALHRRASRVLLQASIQRDATGLSVNEDQELLKLWAQQFAIQDTTPSHITDAELAAASKLCDRRYDCESWNQRR